MSKSEAPGKEEFSSFGITRENMRFTLPPALKGDEAASALAEAAAGVLAERLSETDRLRIFSAVDTLPEDVLDILARDFKVDWWDPDFTLAQKRRTIKSSFRVHKRLGTQAAVDEAISAIYPDSKAEPWFVYGGEPYHFRFKINTENAAENLEADLAKQAKILQLAKYYKSLRDHLDEMHYTAGVKVPAVIHFGGVGAAAVCFPVPEAVDSFAFSGTVYAGSGAALVATVPVPEQSVTKPGGGAITETIYTAREE